MAKGTKGNRTTQICDLAEKILAQNPSGIRYTQLCNQISNLAPKLNRRTIGSVVWKAPASDSNSIKRPTRGWYFHSKYLDSPKDPHDERAKQSKPRRESGFYRSFAEWMERDIEEVTRAVPLGGAQFHGKWGTPDVIGKRESPKTSILPVPMELTPTSL